MQCIWAYPLQIKNGFLGIFTLFEGGSAWERSYHSWRLQYNKIKVIRDPFGEKLEDLMAELDLLDPMPKNGKFTWSNK